MFKRQFKFISPTVVSLFTFASILFTRLSVCSAAGANLYEYEENPIWTADKNTPSLRLARDLTRNYNPNVRPVLNDSTVTLIDHLYILHQIVYLDSKDQRLKALYFEVWKWTDEFLQWDPDDYAGIESISLSREQVWLPDIVVYNELGDNYNYFMKENLIPVNIQSTGEVKCETPLMLETICMLDISDFPYDNQTCKVKVGSWSQPATKITLINTNAGVDLSDYTENSEWELTDTKALNVSKPYPGVSYNFSELEYTIMLRRRTPFYERNMIIPTVLTSMMSILVFLLPPESGEKISLAITVFLALSLNMLVISDHIPVNSLQIPVVSKYSLFSLGTITISLWMSIIVINVHGYRTNKSSHYLTHPPKLLVILSRKLWPYISVRNRPVRVINKTVNSVNGSITAIGPGTAGQNHQPVKKSGSFLDSRKKNKSQNNTAEIYQNGVLGLHPQNNNNTRLANPRTKPANQKPPSHAPTSYIYSHLPSDVINTNSPRTTKRGFLADTEQQVRQAESWTNMHAENGQTAESSFEDRNFGDLENPINNNDCNSNSPLCSNCCSVVERALSSLSQLAEVISAKEMADEKAASDSDIECEQIVQEWTLIASVLDRILAIGYLIVNTTVTIMCFLPYYASSDDNNNTYG